eukprot:gnl/Hemi2/25519_TR8583_c0_g1_i3.p1 gnl/Hemi2/25519_TR8583_c0_g1~~gnl/Hemi2/25519_TR8583_c0_g1_i3.p1  ORF type:complete len:825 (-),score=387.65 gnl/Hemi2/25519_TR8583_c0_g1_i3:145-2619(-)
MSDFESRQQDLDDVYNKFRHSAPARRVPGAPRSRTATRDNAIAGTAHIPVVFDPQMPPNESFDANILLKQQFDHQLRTAKQQHQEDRQHLEDRVKDQQRALRSHERHMVKTVNELTQEVAIHKAESEKLNNMLDLSQERENTLKRENAEMVGQIRGLWNQAHANQNTIAALERQVDELHGELQREQTKVATLDERCRQEVLRSQKSQLETNDAAEGSRVLKQQLELRNRDVQDVEARLRDLKEAFALHQVQTEHRADEWAQQLDMVRLQLSQAERALDSQANELEAKNLQLAKLLDENRSKGDNLQVAANTISELRSQLDRLCLERANAERVAEREHSEVRIRDDVVRQLTADKAALEKLAEERRLEAAKAVKQRTKQLARKDTECARAVDEAKNRYDNEIRRAQDEVKLTSVEKDRRIRELHDQLAQSSDELKLAMEEVLSRRKEVDSANSESKQLAGALRSLEAEANERATRLMIVEEEMSRQHEVMRSLTLELDAKHHETVDLTRAMQSLEGEAAIHAKAMNASQEQINKLESQMRQVNDEKRLLNERIRAMEKRELTLTHQLEAERSKAEWEMERISKEAHLTLDERHRQTKDVLNQNTQIKADLLTSREEMIRMQAEIEMLRNESARCRVAESDAMERLAVIKNYEEDLIRLREAVRALTTDLELKKDRIAHLEQENDRLSGKVLKADAFKDSADHQLNQLTNIVSRTLGLKKENSLSNDLRQAEIRHELEGRIDELNSALRSSRRVHNASHESELADLQARLSALQADSLGCAVHGSPEYIRSLEQQLKTLERAAASKRAGDVDEWPTRQSDSSSDFE